VDRRRSPRYAVDLSCRMSVAGRAPISARVLDLSEGGAKLQTDDAVAAGATGTLQVDGNALPIPFAVRGEGGRTLSVAFQLDEAASKSWQGVLARMSLRRAA
jgi:hypothetical protein